MSGTRLHAKVRDGIRPGKVVKRSLGAVLIAVVLGVLLHVPSIGPAYAEPYKSESGCGSSAKYHNHVKVAASGGHYADVSVHVCHNGSIIKWASQPSLTFPGYKILGVPAPQAALESVSATTPTIYSYGAGIGGNKRITWRFTVTVKALKGGVPIATQTYYFRVYPAYSELQGHANLAQAKLIVG